MPRAGRSPRPTPMVAASYVANCSTAWFLSGLGAVLPDLEQHIGRRASLYPLLPGALLLVWGMVVVRRHRGADPSSPHAPVFVASTLGLGAAIVVMGVTRWGWVSALGALTAAFTTATLIRLVPAVIATAHTIETQRVMMRANAWASIASISSPLAIGASIAVGAGWLPGMAIPIAIGAIVVAFTARTPAHEAARPQRHPGSEIVPPFATWRREWLVLTLCIMVEFCFAYFVATYLHDELGLSTAAAAAGGAAWGIGMSVGRFAVSTWPPPRTITPSIALIGAGFVLMWGVAQPAASILGIGLAGLGAAPLYPTRITALLDRFPASPDQGAARGGLSSGVALLSAPALMAGLRAVTDVRTAYLAVPVLLACLALLAGPIRPVGRAPHVVSPVRS